MRWFLLLLLAALPAFSTAQELSASMDKAAALEKLITVEGMNDRIPRISDPKVAELFRAATDSRFLDTANHSLDASDPLEVACDRANRIMMTYQLFGLKKFADGESDDALIQRIQTRMIENFVTYQDEMAILQPFATRCMAKRIPLTTEFAASLKPEQMTESRIQGLRQMQEGFFRMYCGFLSVFNVKELNDSYRTKMLGALSETAPVYSSVLDPETRAQIRVFAQQVKSHAKNKFHGGIEEIIRAMSDTECTGLCKI